MARILFVTDSAADLPKDLRESLQIRVLPFPIAMEDREYLDGESFAPEEFYRMMLDAPRIPTHAQLTPFLFHQLYREALEEGYSDLIYVSINAKGSATHQNALQARSNFLEEYPQAAAQFQIHVVDSRTYTMAYGYAVAEGARRAARGASPQEVLAFIQDWLDHARILFTPFDLKFAKKSGRVSAAAAFVGEALGIKPVLTFEDGVSKILTKLRGEKNVIPGLVELCKKNRQPGSPYFVLRGCNAEQAEQLAAACRQALGEDPALECYVGGVIAINAGPNLVGLVYREA